MASEVASRVKALYSVMQSCESRLGGGEGVEGLYGSISKGGMDKVLKSLQEHTGLDSTSTLVDVGAGLGRPLLHALVDPGINDAFGIELDGVKCDKAAAFVMQTLGELQRRGVLDEGVPYPTVRQAAIEEVATLDPATHAYSFWEGVPASGKAAMGRLFAASSTLRAVAVVQRGVRTPPVQMMAEHGFGALRLVSMFSVSMSGSGQSFKAYVFARTEPLGAPQPPPQKALCAAAATSASTPAPATALPRLRARRAPRVTEMLRGRRTRQGTAAAAAKEREGNNAADAPTQQQKQPKSKAPDAENVPPTLRGGPEGTEATGSGSPVSPPCPSPPQPAASRRRGARRASLDTRASVDLQSPVTGEVRAARSLEGAADTASKVSPVKVPNGLKLTGRVQPNAARALRPTNEGGATLVGSMRQRRRGQQLTKHSATVDEAPATAVDV